MQTIQIERDTINIEALDATLRTLLADEYFGLSTRAGTVRVHLSDAVSEAQLLQAQQAVREHDAAHLTQAQQQRMTRQSRLQNTRADQLATELDLTTFDALSPVLQALARRVYWLEQEIRDLRDF